LETSLLCRWNELVPRQLRVDRSCCYYVTKEAKIILLGASAIFWAIWLIRNKIIFCKKLATDPKEMVSQVSSLQSWASLQKQDDKECALGFAAKLKDAALKIFSDLNTYAEWWNI
jgi:hypothetical protein